MANPKFKKFSKKFAFFPRNFSIIFQIFINFNANFWKITPNFKALPTIKFRFTLEKSEPPKHLEDPLNRKILHALLHFHFYWWLFAHFSNIRFSLFWLTFRIESVSDIMSCFPFDWGGKLCKWNWLFGLGNT